MTRLKWFFRPQRDVCATAWFLCHPDEWPKKAIFVPLHDFYATTWFLCHRDEWPNKSDFFMPPIHSPQISFGNSPTHGTQLQINVSWFEDVLNLVVDKMNPPPTNEWLGAKKVQHGFINVHLERSSGQICADLRLVNWQKSTFDRANNCYRICYRVFVQLWPKDVTSLNQPITTLVYSDSSSKGWQE